jgi:uncharacterized protein
MKHSIKVVMIHGNGGGKATDYWFPTVKKYLESIGIQVDCRDFPDSQVAHENIWLPFLKNEIKTDKNTILLGHSSGACASMRYAENNKILGSILVGASYTDTNDENERKSGYFSRPWKWDKIKANQNWIMQFASIDDPYIKIDEPRLIHKKLNTQYFEYKDKGHFMFPDFPELIEVLKAKLT